MAEIVEVLRDAGVLTDVPRALLQPTEQDARPPLALIEDFVVSHPAAMEELAYLTNALIAGCSIQARSFAPQEAADAVAAICNLGLESWPHHWTDCDLVTAFQVGWTVLHRDVSMFAAERLIALLAEIRCDDPDIQSGLQGLRHELVKGVRDATPWQARNALDVILMLDAPCWAALIALTDQCPVLHAAIRASRGRSHSIDPSSYEFISQHSQIIIVREFMESLATRLTG